jgi:SAM-dependent methyltransferase
MNHSETDSILSLYRRRDLSITPDTYSLSRDENLFFYHGRTRHALALLRNAGFFPCADKTVLEVGCGSRGWLPDFESWGVLRANLAGIDLDQDRVVTIRKLLSGSSLTLHEAPTGGADIRIGDASQLPWPDATFDLLVQSTVFTSILSPDLKRRVASEMLRVLRPGGIILWYDFVYNNPANANVRGIGLGEVRQLFPNCSLRTRSVTLAPPIARVIVPLSWLTGEFLQALRVLNTHRLILIRRAQ